MVKKKVQYYLGTYIAYFIAIYALLYLASFSNYGKATANILYNSSFQSQVYSNCNQCDSGANPILADVYRKYNRVREAMNLEKELKLVALQRTSSTRPSEQVEVANAQSTKLLDKVFLSNDEIFSKGFRKYVSQQFTLLGCAPLLYPDGFQLHWACIRIKLPPARYENILLYLCHNHPLFSCLYFMPGSKLGPHGTRILYLGQAIVVFVLYQFTAMLLQYFGLEDYGLGTIINLLVITPLAVTIGAILRWLYVCPFTESIHFQRRYRRYHSIILLVGRLALLPLLLLMGISLVLACLFSQGREKYTTLYNFFIYVQLYGVLREVVQAIALFTDEYYYHMSFGGGVINVFRIGELFKERIIAKNLENNKDYAYRIRRYFFGLVVTETILNREDAIKAKWIAAHEVYEVQTVSEGTSSVENPMIPQDVVEMVAVKCEEVSLEDDPVVEDVEESIHEVAYDNIYQVNEEVKSSNTSPNPLFKTIQSRKEAQDDESLFIEYQTHCSNDEYHVDGEQLTFEEWKVKRKEFKQGTRRSFVKAFQIFEEREQQHQLGSSSVVNTMHLNKQVSVKSNPLKRK